MKKLLLAGALVVGLSFPLSSQAEVSAFGVQLPAENAEVSNNINGTYVAQSLSDTFVVQKLQNSSEAASAESVDSNTYYVFGVKLSSDNAS
jgi:hypothetical protein